jgi:hypothetical protein
MKEYEIAISVAKGIVVEKLDFSQAAKKYCLGVDHEARKRIIGLVGIFLRNYFFVEGFVRELFNLASDEDVVSIGIPYVDVALKKYNSKDVAYSFIGDYLKEKGIAFDDDSKAKLDEVVEKKRRYELKDVRSGSLDYFMIRYNLPKWFLKMMLNQYDRQTMILVARECSRMPKQYAILNKFVDIPEELKKDFSNFSKVNDELFVYNPTTSIRRDPLVHEGMLLPLQKASNRVVRYLLSLNEGKVSFYIGHRTFDFMPILNRYGANSSISFFAPSVKDNFDVFSKIKKMSKLNQHIYECDEEGLIAYLSEKQDIVCYFPNNSCLEALRRAPDYGIIFDTSGLDSLIVKELLGLEGLAKEVKDGGYLIYAVDTINIKETVVLIKKFLLLHDEFSLDKEELSFPYDEDNSIYYYAILRKTK